MPTKWEDRIRERYYKNKTIGIFVILYILPTQFCVGDGVFFFVSKTEYHNLPQLQLEIKTTNLIRNIFFALQVNFLIATIREARLIEGVSLNFG